MVFPCPVFAATVGNRVPARAGPQTRLAGVLPGKWDVGSRFRRVSCVSVRGRLAKRRAGRRRRDLCVVEDGEGGGARGSLEREKREGAIVQEEIE